MKVSIPTTVPLLSEEEMDRLWHDRPYGEAPTVAEVRTVAAYWAATGRAIYQPMADLVAGKEVCVEHLGDVAVWACSLSGGTIRTWLESITPKKENA